MLKKEYIHQKMSGHLFQSSLTTQKSFLHSSTAPPPPPPPPNKYKDEY